MANEKRLIAYDPITFESFIRHATKHFDPYYAPYDEGYMDAVDSIEGWLEHNTVDAVEVVRCKDCRSKIHDNASNEDWCNNPGGLCCRLKDDYFCPFGERKQT